MHASLAVAAGLVGLASAATTTSTAPIVSMFPVTTQTHFNAPECTGAAASVEQKFTVNYNFDTISGNELTATTEVAEYNLLNFQNILYVDTDPDQDGNHLGLAPYTYPAAAAFSSNTSAGILAPFGTSTPYITANYTQSTVSSFRPQSWWYGCVADSPYTAGSLPESCNITATGYNVAGNKVATQDFVFTKNSSIINDQVYGTFHPGFAGIYTLGFAVASQTLEGLVPVSALVDNIIATLSQEACAPFYIGSYNNGSYPY